MPNKANDRTILINPFSKILVIIACVSLEAVSKYKITGEKRISMLRAKPVNLCDIDRTDVS